MQKEEYMALVGTADKDLGLVKEFDDSRFGLVENREYTVHIIGGAAGMNGSTRRNIVVAATEGAVKEDSDFFVTTVGNNAFVSAGVRTAKDKQAAAEDANCFFSLKWVFERDAMGRKVMRPSQSNPREEFCRKTYTCNKL